MERAIITESEIRCDEMERAIITKSDRRCHEMKKYMLLMYYIKINL